MNLNEIIKTSFFASIWIFLFQISTGLLFVAVKRIMRQLVTAKETKAGKIRCQEVFHCHCEKENGHEIKGSRHVNETNMVVW